MDSYLDLSPRVGLAYDLFGNGKTSLKANVGRYLHRRRTPAASREPGGAPHVASRPWTDGNGNYRWIATS